MPVRLHLDGWQTLWALVRCEFCTEVNKYLALEAALVPIGCKKCGQSLDVRKLVLADAVAHPEISAELLLTLRKAGRPTPSTGTASDATPTPAAVERRPTDAISDQKGSP